MDLVLVNGIATPAPAAPEIDVPADEPSLVRRYVKARRRSHASTPQELAKYIEYRFIDLVEQPGATPEQQFAALRELAKFPALGLTSHNKVTGPQPGWQPAAETVDVLDRL